MHEAAPRGGRDVEDGLVEFDEDLVGNGQHRPVLGHGLPEDLLRGRALAHTREALRDTGPVHQHGGDVPDHHDRRDDDEDRSGIAGPELAEEAEARGADEGD